MFKVEAVATVYYTCSLSDEDGQKVLDYIKENSKEYQFMSAKKRIVKAVQELHENGEIDIYQFSDENDFCTEEINWSEFEEKTAEEILITQKTEDVISDKEKMDKIFHELFSHFNSHHSKILKNYEMTSDEKREELLRKSYVIVDDFVENGAKPIYYTNEELAIFCLMIKKDWQYLKELQNWG